MLVVSHPMGFALEVASQNVLVHAGSLIEHGTRHKPKWRNW
jgi:ABC-type histidine transport system ATPase subunit